MMRQISAASCVVGLALALPSWGAAHSSQAQVAGQSNAAELELKACGLKDKEVKYSADTDKSRHPTDLLPPVAYGDGLHEGTHTS
jgi:hypothetical protein